MPCIRPCFYLGAIPAPLRASAIWPPNRAREYLVSTDLIIIFSDTWMTQMWIKEWPKDTRRSGEEWPNSTRRSGEEDASIFLCVNKARRLQRIWKVQVIIVLNWISICLYAFYVVHMLYVWVYACVRERKKIPNLKKRLACVIVYAWVHACTLLQFWKFVLLNWIGGWKDDGGYADVRQGW